jgi:hypothetical protein
MSANGRSHIDQKLVKDSVPGNPGGNAYQAFVKKLPSLVGCGVRLQSTRHGGMALMWLSESGHS